MLSDSPLSEPKEELDDTDDALLEYVKQLSATDPVEMSSVKSEPLYGDLSEMITSLRREHLKRDTFLFIVKRDHVLHDALRRMQKPTFSVDLEMMVSFIGEDGDDSGGLTREFFTLLPKEILNQFMEPTGVFRHDAVALQNNVYIRLGQLASAALLQGGAGFHIFSTSVWNYLTGMKVSDITVGEDEISDFQVKVISGEITQSTTGSELQGVIECHYDFLYSCGWTKPSILIREKDKVDIIHAISLHHVILRSKAELDQFSEGFEACGVFAAIEQNPDVAREFFYHQWPGTFNISSTACSLQSN